MTSSRPCSSARLPYLSRSEFVVPALHDVLDVELAVEPHGDQRALGRQNAETWVNADAARVVDAHGVGGQEEVRRVPRRLRPLVLRRCVLDGEAVEAELLGELRELVVVGHAQIGPDDAVGLLEVVGDLLEREVVGFDDAVAPHPRANCARRHGPSLPGVKPIPRTCTDFVLK